MTDIISRKELLKITRGFTRFPDIASSHIYAAQKLNANEAERYMRTLAPTDTGTTKSNSVAIAYKNEGVIGFAMSTERENKEARASGGKGRRRKKGFASQATKDERIRAILFANKTDFFYGVWNLNKKTWKGRMKRAMKKSAKQVAGGMK